MSGDALGAAGRLVDVLLHREVERTRAGEGPVPHDFAGLVLDDAEVDDLLRGTVAAVGLDPAWDGVVDERRADLAAALAASTDPLGRLAAGARLDPVAAEVLAALTAVDADARRQRLVAYVQNNVAAGRPSLALVERLWGRAGLDAVAPGGPLDRAAVLATESEATWALQRVGVPTVVVWLAHGAPVSVDPDLPADARIHGEPGPPAEPLVHLAHTGDRVSRRRAVLAAGVPAVVECPTVPTTPAGWEAVVRTATATGAAVALEVPAVTADVRRWVERADHLTWVLGSPHELPLSDLPRRRWRDLAVEATPTGQLDHTQLELVAGALDGVGGDVGTATRRLASGDLHQFTQRIRPRRSWDDLVVPPGQRDALRHLCDRFRHRHTVHDVWGFKAVPSAGVTALFAGESGTGKTLAAEVVAGELGLDVYKLDLDGVLSKWIGETEQNLERVFTAAGTADVLLFFDEADALFGKRSAVADAHDRYANIEVAYLLQRLERHDGLVVLATNLQRNIDPAFLRRLHVVVEFALPGVEERRRIWAGSIPGSAPVGDVDLDDLAARWELSGGAIRNAALYAGFAAAAEDCAIEDRHCRAGVERELRKLGRLVGIVGKEPARAAAGR